MIPLKPYKTLQHAFLKAIGKTRHPNKKQIHQLRLHIKQLRALLKLIAAIAPNGFSKKAFNRSLSKIYKPAGDVRMAELNVELLDDDNAGEQTAFKAHLKASKKKAGKKLSKQLKAFDGKTFRQHFKKALHAISGMDVQTLDNKIHHYINTLLSAVQQDLASLGKDEVLHDVRKKLKAIKAIYALTGVVQSQLSTHLVKTLEEKIGNWHDHVVLAQTLQSFIGSANKNSALAALLSKIKLKNNRVKKQIALQLKQPFGALTV